MSTRTAAWFVVLLTLSVSACAGTPRYTAGAGAFGREEATFKPPADDSPAEKTESWQPLYSGLLGTPYVRGGSTPRGFDCSGLVGYVYRSYDGRQLPRTVSALYGWGHPISRADLKTGDLVFYNTSGRGPSHVGIYLWGDTFLHSSRSEGVVLSRLGERYYAQRYIGARRLSD